MKQISEKLFFLFFNQFPNLGKG